MSADTKNQPILKKLEDGYVNHPSGLWEKRITAEELIRNWEKYINTHAHLYANAGSLQHELSTRSQIVKKGTDVSINRGMTKTGISYNIIGAAPAQKAEMQFEGFKRFRK
jgi:hypothetical protein